eukprot:tig00021493_g21869.t1
MEVAEAQPLDPQRQSLASEGPSSPHGRASDAASTVVKSLFQEGEVTMSTERLRGVLNDVCPDMSEEEAETIISSLDSDHDGFVHKDDVVKLFQAFASQVPAAPEGSATPKQRTAVGPRRVSGSPAVQGRPSKSGQERLRDLVSELQTKNKMLLETLATMQEQLVSAESELFSTAQRAEGLDAEVTSLRDERAATKGVLMEYAAKVAEAEAANDALRGAAARDAAELARLAGELDGARRELVEARSALDAERAARETAEADVAHLRAECARLKEALLAESAGRAAKRRESRQSVAARVSPAPPRPAPPAPAPARVRGRRQASVVAKELGLPVPAALRSPLAERDENAGSGGAGLEGIAEGEEELAGVLQEQNEHLLAAHRALDARFGDERARASKMAERLQELERAMQLEKVEKERERVAAEARMRQMEEEARVLRQQLDKEAKQKREVEAGRAELEAAVRSTRSQLKTRDEALKKATEERLKAAFAADRLKKERERLEKEKAATAAAAAAAAKGPCCAGGEGAGEAGDGGAGGPGSRALTVAKPWAARPKTAPATATAKERQEKALAAAMARLALVAKKKQEATKDKRWR